MKVVDYLERDDALFDHVLHRDHCLVHESRGMIVKDLSLLQSGRKMEDMVIIDNKVTSYALNLENGIPIKDFIGDRQDRELKQLTMYLMSRILNAKDVRAVIKEDFLDTNMLISKAKQFGLGPPPAK